MNAEQAWQSVLGQLQMEMPKASFDTWVRDTKPVSYQDGTLTIGARNVYARDWLESRLASTISRLLVGILNASASVQFVVSNIEDTSSSDAFDEERSRAGESEDSHPEDSQELTALDYDSVYEQIVNPRRAAYVLGYFRRWLKSIGPDLGWMYIAFYQAAYSAGTRTGKATNRIPGRKLAALAGITERTYWNRVENETMWKKLKGLVNISDHGPEWDNTSPTPKRLPRRYTVAMTLPLTPVDAASLSKWLATHIEQYDGSEGVLRAAAEAPLAELIPLDTTDTAQPITVRMLVRDLFSGGELSGELLDSLASAIQNHIMPQNDLIVVTQYFLGHVLPRLGAGPGWMVTLLRDMCYTDPATGETRNRVTVKGGYAEIAGWLGMSRPLTIYEWLHGKKGNGFKEPILRIYAREIPKEEKQLDFGAQPRLFEVLLEEIPHELLEIAVTHLDYATFSIAFTQLSESVYADFSMGFTRLSVSNYADFSIAVTRFAEDIYASCRVKNLNLFKTNTLNSENTTSLNTSDDRNGKLSRTRKQKSVEQDAVNSLPSAWVLDRLLILNKVHPKTQKAVRGSSAQALVSWLLYALSPDGRGIDKPMSYALARLKDDPKSGAGDQYDKLANLSPTDLIDVAYKASRGGLKAVLHRSELDELADLWIDAMGMDDSAARKLMRYLVGDKSPDIRQKITTSERIEFTNEGVEITTEESIEEI